MLLLLPLFFLHCFFWECSRNSTEVSNMYITKAHENITHSHMRTHIRPERLSLSLSLSLSCLSLTHKTDKHRHRRLRDYMMRRRQHTLTYTFFVAVVVVVALFLSLYRRTPHNTRKYRYCFQSGMYMRCSDRFENFIVTISIVKNIRKNKN